MLRKFRIKLNDKEYEVEMEEIGALAQVNVSYTPATAEPKVEAVQESQPTVIQVPAQDVTGGHEVISPMPGNILDVAVKLGDSVSVNQKLLVLEAMKMENNIVSPVDGVVVAINVTKGENVDVGTVMVVIK